jgi:Arc/MetJ-type ribon-helix-helix transcriptional regulator
VTDDFEPQKFEVYLSLESEAKINALISAGKVGSASEALLLAVDLGLDKLAED